MTDKDVIKELLDQLNSQLGWNYVTTSYPDVDNRKSKDIDLIAKCENLPDLAIEETRITSFTNQTGFEEKIKKYYLAKLETLQSEIKPGITCYLPVNIFDLDNGDYDETSQKIFSIISSQQQQLKQGIHEFQIPETQLKFKILYKSNSSHKFRINVRIDEGQLCSSLKKALSHKKQKLQHYSKLGYQAMLVISDYDFQNNSPQSIFEKYQIFDKQGYCDHLDYVFYHDNSTQWYCFKGEDQCIEKFNTIQL